MQVAQYPASYPQHPLASSHYPPMTVYPPFPPSSIQDPRLPPPIPIMHATASHKRPAPSHPHPAESPAKKKQSKWTADEDASIIQLRGDGMKWEDISKHLPGRSAISCRLRFQNYLERRSEWDEEKKNKLARLYDRFKKDMWEKVSKEMHLPWRAAEAMHWQIGEVEMASRANVPVFHLANQNSTQAGAASERSNSVSPPSAAAPLSTYPYPVVHNHNFPQMQSSQALSAPPDQTRLRSNSNGSSQTAMASQRRRADSARSIHNAAATNGMYLPPVGEIVGHPAQARYTLPPVLTSPDVVRR